MDFKALSNEQDHLRTKHTRRRRKISETHTHSQQIEKESLNLPSPNPAEQNTVRSELLILSDGANNDAIKTHLAAIYLSLIHISEPTRR